VWGRLNSSKEFLANGRHALFAHRRLRRAMDDRYGLLVVDSSLIARHVTVEVSHDLRDRASGT